MTPAAADPQTIQAEIKAEKTSSSKGERLFDWITYGGIAGLGTFVLTIPIAYWAKYGGGAKHFINGGKRLQNLGLGEHTAEHAMMTTATMQGGNVTIIPVKIMENYKPQLVEKFNKLLGDKSEDASIENDPKQTWGSLVKARIFLAWLPVFASFKATGMLIGEDKFAAFQNNFSKGVCDILGKSTHFPGMAKIAANETKLFRYGKIGALDLFATAAASTLLYIGSRFFAKKNEHWHAQHTHIPPQTPSHEPETPAPALHAAIAPRPRSFADSLAAQKAAVEPSLTLGA